MSKRFIPFLAFASMAFIFVSNPSAMAADAPTGQAEYDRIGCWSCHGYQGQGGRDGPDIARPQLPYAAFSSFVRTTSGAMPPFTERVLPEADLENIYAFLQSRPPPPSPDTIPLLQE